MSNTATMNNTGNAKDAEFKAPWHVLTIGVFSIASLYCVGKAFSLKIISDMRGETMDASSVMLLAIVVGCVAECLGAAYLYRRRKHGAKSKSAPLFIIALMVMMLVPIQFAALSIWVN